ncbi:helix-turn-helix domain-containing protein [Streptomyces sp. NPDC057199]|uniref:ArsR/SmtB family transcription factor n=1 Tax=Streptomyces sp. NPDC057199 TaxID=3346047 RepID=UPI003628D8B1
MCRLQTRQGPLEFGHWRQSVRERIQQDAPLNRALQPLKSLIPSFGYIPDFLTPPVTGADLSAGLELVRATPRRRLASELTQLAGSRPVPSWAASLGRPGCGALSSLAQALGVYFGALLAPSWSHVRTVVGNDVGIRTQALLDGGTQALLNGLRPLARWNSPVLEVDYPVERDLHLGGRGLTLVPSYFCWRRPTALADPGLPPVLVYPVAKNPLDLPCTTEDGLVRLLGRSRAAVLVEVVRRSGRTTSEVAAAVGLALPSVSYQIGVLRDGGLVASHRDGKYVLHTATPLGRQLLAVAPWDEAGVVSTPGGPGSFRR